MKTQKDILYLKNLNKQLNAIVDTSSDGIWVCDKEGVVIYINRASELLNNVSAKEVVGKPASYLVTEGLMDRNVTYEVIKKRQQVSMMQKITKTGKHLLVTGTPAFDEEERLFLVVLNERDITELGELTEKLKQTQMLNEKIKDELAAMHTVVNKTSGIIAESDEMKKVLITAVKLSRIESENILITGESGTGKGLLANFIHQNSNRKQKPFIQINCAALPENLLEAELFGYEKGAFTGANQKGKAGLIELAHGGSLFLDEIGELPIQLQAKLLKYLDDKKLMRLGGTTLQDINCNIIAATNRNLEEMVRKKTFRQDLYYRLNTFTIFIPPLRQRSVDLIEMTQYFLKKYNKTFEKEKYISYDGLKELKKYSFPGNVRELKNLIKNAVVLCESRYIDKCLRNNFLAFSHKKETSKAPLVLQPLKTVLQTAERQLLKAAVDHCKSTRHIADVLCISQPTVVRKLKKHFLQTN